MRLIVTRPQYDLTTRYLSAWAREIINLAEKKGFEVFDLEKERANKKEFVGRIHKTSPEIVFLSGHGTDTAVFGNNDELLVTDSDCEILNGRITYSVSCNSAKSLGKNVGKNKNTAYIGYLDKFFFMADRNYLSRPLDDPRAKPFMEASNQVMVSLLKGHTVEEASRRSKDLFQSHYHLLASTTDPNALQVAQLLWWDMEQQDCSGDLQAKIIIN